MSTLSVIIPTLNEAAHLPGLLAALHGQTHPPTEIIVADAGSTDETVACAEQLGARVVPGGMPGPGRNAGARAATGEIFLFLDADVLPGPEFIARTLAEFEASGWVVATCPTEALSDDLGDQLIMDITNLYLQVILPVSPRAPGFCIFARRAVHETLGGFDETLKMSEDHDYVRRAAHFGRFGLLKSAKIPVSMRRLEKEGLVGLALKYAWCEMHALAGKPIRSMPFEYEFGAFQPALNAEHGASAPIEKLRRRLGHFENPIHALSRAGLEQFRRLAEFDPLDFANEQVRFLLDRHDLEVLEKYLLRRLPLGKTYRSLTRQWSRLTQPRGVKLETLLKKSARQHRQLCPRQVLGVRLGLAGLQILGFSRPPAEKRLLVITETDGCFVDGLSAATGCTVGHRTLRVEDYGKTAAVFIDTVTGLSWRVAPIPALREKASAGQPEKAAAYQAQMQAYQSLPTEAMFTFQPVKLQRSLESLLSQPGRRVLCAQCGEEIMNEREMLAAGRPLCQTCAGAGYYSVETAA